MAKKKSEENCETDIFRIISNGIGAELLEDRDKNAWGYIDTGVLSLNFILSGKFFGGGVPGGVCLECFGGSSSGKSLISSGLLKGGQEKNGIAVLIDAERTLSKDFAVKASHVDPKKFIVVESDTLENSFNQIHKIIRMVRQDAKVPLERPLVISYDSLSVSPSNREYAETGLDLETASVTEIKNFGAGADKPGERAKICSKELRKLPPILAENNVTILFVNQVRNKIGVFAGNPEVVAGGGLALEFYCSMRLRMSGNKHIKDSETSKTIGINVNINCVKNKCFMPFGKVNNLRLFFDKGMDPFGGLLELLLQEKRIEATSSGNYKVCEPYADGQEIKFKSSKERNDVPGDVLLKCPALVDATDPSQIQKYIDIFGGAVLDENENIVEEDIVNEE